MSQRRFINPSRTIFPDIRPFYYAVSNTPVRDICGDIPIGNSAGQQPLRICLQGAGDIRNVLHSVYSRRKIGDKQRIEFYVNDHNPAIVARDILLLTLASRAPQGNNDSLKRFVDVFFSIYADLSLNEAAGRQLDDLLDELLNDFPSVGGAMSIPALEHLWHVKKTWALWKTNRKSIQDAQQLRNEQTRNHYAERVLVPGHAASSPTGQLAEAAMGFEMLLNRDLAANPTMRNELLHYFQTGSVLESQTGGPAVVESVKQIYSPPGKCNWTLFDPETKQFLHYLSHPFQLLISASEASDFQADNQTLLASVKSVFCRLIKTFAANMTKSEVRIIFDVGDCNSFMSQRIPSDITFDVIDTSNLADNLGLVNMLLLASHKLNRDETHSTLWVELLKAHLDYSNVVKFLYDSLGFPYSLLGTILKLQCSLPFESSLLFDEYHEYSGRNSRSNLIKGLVLKFNPTPYPRGITPTSLQLVPKPSECVFRQMIDNYLTSLYDLYTGRIPKKEQAPAFFMSISTLLLLMCSTAHAMENPRELFEHLYAKVRKCKIKKDSHTARSLDVFAFDVQVSSLHLCPMKYQPTQPLHPYFSDTCGLHTLHKDVEHTQARAIHPSPIVGWIMVESLTAEDKVILQSAADPTSIFKRQSQDTLLTWAATNANRLQFVDSIHVSFPDRQVEITVPSFATPGTSPKNVTFLALELENGWLLYQPLVTTLPTSQENYLAGNNSKLSKPVPEQAMASAAIPDASDLRSDELSVFCLHECKDCFKVCLLLRTHSLDSSRSNLTLITSLDDKNPLCLTLKVNAPMKGRKVKRLQTKMWVPSFIESNQTCKIDTSDKHVIHAMLRKDMQPRRETLNMRSLQKWPVSRPLGVLHSMFTATELQASEAVGGLPFGHDSYLDARNTLHAIYTSLIDKKEEKERGVIKLSELGGKHFLLVSSLHHGFLAYMPGLLITPTGTPVIELHYLVAHGPPVGEAQRFLSFISREEEDVKQTIRCSTPEVDFLISLLEKNYQLQSDDSSKHVTMDGIRLKRSFLVPLYPKEYPFGQTQPQQTASPVMEELDQRRRQSYGESYRQIFPDRKDNTSAVVRGSAQIPEKAMVTALPERSVAIGKQRQTGYSQPGVHCSFCESKAANLRRCTRCQRALYCNEVCQRKDWKRHKKQCASK